MLNVGSRYCGSNCQLETINYPFVQRGMVAQGVPYQANIEAIDGRNTYVLATFPGERLLGKILTSPAIPNHVAQPLPALKVKRCREGIPRLPPELATPNSANRVILLYP